MKKNIPAKVELFKTIIDFTKDAKPTISDYNTLYAEIFGQYPNVQCIIMIDAENGYQPQLMPFYTYVGGLIDTIYFDIGAENTGYLILS